MARERTIGGWILGRRLGHGGNAHVYVATKGDQTAALKVLRDRRTNRLARFRDEIAAMQACADIPGVLPVLDFHVPRAAESGPAWLVTGLATPIKDALGENPSLRRVVEAIRDIARTLERMHARAYTHRDIKPENLFSYQDRWSVGDFGLADFEGKDAQTQFRERIGPVHYIAPEMLNSAAQADGAAADVYSLAKTLWVLATGQAFPLPGSYDRETPAFSIAAYVTESGTRQLDSLIAACTVFAPQSRPSMNRFAQELDAWLQPPAAPAAPIRIDISNYAAQLEQRRVAFEAANEREQRLQKQRNDISRRIRERLRPLAKDIEVSLREAHFTAVSMNIENYHWGFEITAAIPDPDGVTTRLQIRVWIDASSLTTVHVSSAFQLESMAQGQMRANTLLWETDVTFLEGGSEEEQQLNRFDARLREELPLAVTTALAVGLDRPQRSASDTVEYHLQVTNAEGRAVPGADVFLLSAEGVYLRNRTNERGVATFGPTAFAATTAFLAHPQYQAVCLSRSRIGSSMHVTMKQEQGTGSIAIVRGWASVPGLAGQIDFVHDAQGRIYLYTKNISVDGGKSQPVQFAVGQRLMLLDSSNASVAITTVAVHGPCFLIDFARG